MSEKRFEIKIGEFEEENIVDNLNRRTIREISDMCKKMNKLHEQNKELKEENQQLRELLENGLGVSQVEIDEELMRGKND